MNDLLKLENQLCFPVYALSREIISQYRPLLTELDLTYPQYLVLLVLWEHEVMSVNQIGDQLHLDSGTLTPLLKRLEAKGLINRNRSTVDERVVVIRLTDDGKKMEDQASCIPMQLVEKMDFSPEEFKVLKQMIQKLLVQYKSNK